MLKHFLTMSFTIAFKVKEVVCIFLYFIISLVYSLLITNFNFNVLCQIIKMPTGLNNTIHLFFPQWRDAGRWQAPLFRSRDLHRPIRGQYSGHMIFIDQSEASIQYARGQLLHADLCCQLLIGHLIPHPPSHVHNLLIYKIQHARDFWLHQASSVCLSVRDSLISQKLKEYKTCYYYFR